MRVSRIAFVAALLSVAASATAGPKPATPKAHSPSPVAVASRPVMSAPTTRGNPHTTAPTTRAGAKPPTVAPTHGNSGKTTAPASATTSTTTSITTPPLNPIAQKISSNHGLQPKMRALLPAGMTLDQASLGFKNQGQFLAALHVSRNLGIPFADLKTAMTGIRPTTTATTGRTTTGTSTTTSPATLSLGQAIHKLRPSADTVTATTTAEHQATADLSTATPTTTSTATSTTTSTATTTSPTTTPSTKKHGK